MEKIKGLIDAPFTPMHENGDVNYEPIPAYAAMLAKNGLKGVFINGSSGTFGSNYASAYGRTHAPCRSVDGCCS